MTRSAVAAAACRMGSPARCTHASLPVSVSIAFRFPRIVPMYSLFPTTTGCIPDISPSLVNARYHFRANGGLTSSPVAPLRETSCASIGQSARSGAAATRRRTALRYFTMFAPPRSIPPLLVLPRPADRHLHPQRIRERRLRQQHPIRLRRRIRVRHLDVVRLVPRHHLIARDPIHHRVHDRTLQRRRLPPPPRLLRRQLRHPRPSEVHLQPPVLDKDPRPHDLPRLRNPLQRPAPQSKVHRRLPLAARP